jgi:hypothetical protein
VREWDVAIVPAMDDEHGAGDRMRGVVGEPGELLQVVPQADLTDADRKEMIDQLSHPLDLRRVLLELCLASSGDLVAWPVTGRSLLNPRRRMSLIGDIQSCNEAVDTRVRGVVPVCARSGVL